MVDDRIQILLHELRDDADIPKAGRSRRHRQIDEANDVVVRQASQGSNFPDHPLRIDEVLKDIVDDLHRDLDLSLLVKG